MHPSSGTSSAASSTAEPSGPELPFSFVGDAGPGFDPASAGARAEQLHADQEAEQRAALDLGAFEIPLVAEESVRDFLHNAGDMAHALAGVGESDWAMTRADLERIAPAATRIINRYEPARAVAQKSDEAAVIIGMGMYSWRSMIERQAVLRAREAPAARRAPLDVHEAAPGPSPAPHGPGSGPGPAPAQTATTSPDGAAPVSVVDGYVTAADRIRQARASAHAAQERITDAQPRQDS